MTAKEIYERIDLSQLPKEKADKLRELEVKTKGFSIQNDRVDESMRNLYAQLKEKKPSALKDLKVEIEKVETKKGEEVIVKETEKVVGKKEVTQKTPTPSSSKKETITEVAKKIRKEGEEWRQALKRAGEEMRKRDDEASKQVKTELQKLIEFVKTDPNFKDFPRTYGKGRKDIDLLKDASEKALAPGRRVSKKGHMNQYGASKGGRKYTENRDNRSDREASKFPKNIFLAKGGRVHRAELMQEGGEVFVPVQILANNPDALVNTTTMSQLFAEGGMAPTRKLFEDGGAINQGNTDADYITYGEVFKTGGKLKYDPARDVQAIVIQDGPFKKMFIKGDFLGGAYRLASGGLSENYIYVSPRKVIFARLKSGEDIKPSNGFWIKKNASGTIYTGKEKAKPAFKKTLKFPLPKAIKVDGPYSQNEKIMKMLGTFSANEAFLRPALSFVRIQDGELISTNAHIMIRLYDKSVEGKNEFVCASNACKKVSESERKELSNPGYKQVLNSAYVDFSEKYNLGELYEALMGAREEVYSKLEKRSKNTYVVIDLELKNNSISFDSMLLLTSVKAAIELGWKNAYISYQEAKTKAIYITEDKLTTNSSYAVLDSVDVILIMPIATSAGFENVKTIEAQQVLADGGEVFVPVQIDANNPDVLVQTTTMSDLFAKGGFVGKGEMVWRKLTASKRIEFLYENFTPQISPRTQEILVNKDYQFLPREVKMTLERVYANMEEYAEGGRIGFEALSKKVSARYVGKRVKPEYQDEYGKTYSKEEADEVGDKVAAKVYRQQQAKMAKGGLTTNFKAPYNGIYYDSTDYNNPYLLIIGNLAWGISDEFGPNFWGNIQEEFYKSTRDFANNHGYRVLEYQLPENVAEWVKEIRSKEYETLRGKQYKINPNENQANFDKGGQIGEGVRAIEVNTDGGPVRILLDNDESAFFISARMNGQYIVDTEVDFETGQVTSNVKDKQIKIEPNPNWTPNEGALHIELDSEKVTQYAEGGFVAIYNGKKINIEADSLYAAKLKAIEELKVPKSKQGLLSVVSNKSMANQDFRFMADGGRLEAQSLEMAQNISVQIAHHAMELKEALEGKTYIEPWVTSMLQRAADNLSDATHYLEGKEDKMAKGGKIREFDDVLVISKNKLGMVEAIGDNIYYVTTPFGETIEATMDDLKKVASFKEGGDVKIGEIATLAKENNATGDQVVKKISAGADVEMEHTEDRKMAMRIAVDHLKEDFNYYEKLRKAGL